MQQSKQNIKSKADVWVLMSAGRREKVFCSVNPTSSKDLHPAPPQRTHRASRSVAGWMIHILHNNWWNEDLKLKKWVFSNDWNWGYIFLGSELPKKYITPILKLFQRLDRAIAKVSGRPEASGWSTSRLRVDDLMPDRLKSSIKNLNNKSVLQSQRRIHFLMKLVRVCVFIILGELPSVVRDMKMWVKRTHQCSSHRKNICDVAKLRSSLGRVWMRERRPDDNDWGGVGGADPVHSLEQHRLLTALPIGWGDVTLCLQY